MKTTALTELNEVTEVSKKHALGALSKILAYAMASDRKVVWTYSEIAKELDVPLVHGRPAPVALMALRAELETLGDYLYPIRGVGYKVSNDAERVEYNQRSSLTRSLRAAEKAVRIGASVNTRELNEHQKSMLENQQRLAGQLVLQHMETKILPQNKKALGKGKQH